LPPEIFEIMIALIDAKPVGGFGGSSSDSETTNR
jgi:hypothetical protein